MRISLPLHISIFFMTTNKIKLGMGMQRRTHVELDMEQNLCPSDVDADAHGDDHQRS